MTRSPASGATARFCGVERKLLPTCRGALAITMFALWTTMGYAANPAAIGDAGADESGWVEVTPVLPLSSRPLRPIPLDVGPAERNTFAVDGNSIFVGADGVVRFTIIVTSAAGATTVSYEGIRCSTRERRSYAFGRSDGTWSPARNERWTRIEPKAINAHHVVLYRDYFCPAGVPVADAREGIMALERGGHPSAKMPY